MFAMAVGVLLLTDQATAVASVGVVNPPWILAFASPLGSDLPRPRGSREGRRLASTYVGYSTADLFFFRTGFTL